jgi:hypothetical protein
LSIYAGGKVQQPPGDHEFVPRSVSLWGLRWHIRRVSALYEDEEDITNSMSAGQDECEEA